ncbi:MAG TPA: hypothetical protein VHW64_05440 [Nocardioides sp.]|jgi:hypothetical protein|uniref:hypothetical protein n=1 Tax=Nocardioides sp. TaxID=35761 RepID=UPI002E36FAC1|nr:hypothetical protein [Nocardioides sp.]HEX3930124.1 hypothetical protein [Nocardioides sp.]
MTAQDSPDRLLLTASVVGDVVGSGIADRSDSAGGPFVAARGGAATTIVPVVAAGMAGALLAVGGVLMGVVAISALHGYPEIIRLGSDGGFAMVGIGGMLAAAVSVAWLNVLGLQCGVLGKALGRSGVVVSVLLLGAIAFIPILGLLVWWPRSLWY